MMKTDDETIKEFEEEILKVFGDIKKPTNPDEAYYRGLLVANATTALLKCVVKLIFLVSNDDLMRVKMASRVTIGLLEDMIRRELNKT